MFAVKVLAQVASASACERNWSEFEYVCSKRRNKLTTGRARDLVYVHSTHKLAEGKATEVAKGIEWVFDGELDTKRRSAVCRRCHCFVPLGHHDG